MRLAHVKALRSSFQTADRKSDMCASVELPEPAKNPGSLQRFEKPDQPEFVAQDRTSSAMVALRYVVLFQARTVQPFVQRVSELIEVRRAVNYRKFSISIRSAPCVSEGANKTDLRSGATENPTPGHLPISATVRTCPVEKS